MNKNFNPGFDTDFNTKGKTALITGANIIIDGGYSIN
jgi:hypothetical protein